jgi:tRNA pseudouridine55 synthase
MRPSPPAGVLIVDKPRGPTSHDVVARVRRVVKSREVGHAGTLDPMATGVLVLAIGEATKLVPWLTAEDKAYEATIRLGIETDTLDAEGNEVARAPVSDEVVRAIADAGEGKPEAGVLLAAINAERSRVSQIPPAFSAIRIGGERAHELARAGKLEADLPPRPVEVRSLDVVGGRIEGDVVELMVRVAVQKGYFVRSLARDLARGLGTLGHLTALRRTRSGRFTDGEAVALDAISNDAILSIDRAAARALPVTRLDPAGVRAVSFGQRVLPEQMTDPHHAPSAWLDSASRLVAIGEVADDGFGRVLRGFAAAQGT